jgi:tetratricopeptide (TPR) repeat protein
MPSPRIIAALVFLSCLRPASAEVRVWQGTLTLPTTVEGPPDPNPPFDLFASTRFNYPYTLRENLAGQEKAIAWRALFLENEYLKCTVLPDIGGHLYTCIDKISGQPMFYANPSIKKAQIGYRGAWAAFGIEFNFPVSHNWVSMSPVEWSTKQNDDGSASIFVGNIDRPYGMQWTVELRLRPGSALLEERVTLYNRSDARHRYYWWNNAGVRVWDDSRICYPMRWTASHGFTRVDTWPVDSSGVDLSVIGNQTRGTVSLFVHGSREPFMGIYHPHTETGVVHYADFAALPGKKIWSWGVDADGLDWRRALSDDNSAYVEVQAGLMRNQETYAFLEPRQTIRFSEFWMPVRAIGGIARANLTGVLNLRREGAELTAGFNSNQAVPGAHIRLLEGERAIFEETADLRPDRTWSHEIPAPAGKATFELRGAGGSVLMRQTEGVYDWSPETEIHAGPQARDVAADPLSAGAELELNGNLPGAYATYERALAGSPNNLMLRLAAGRLAATLLRYDDAVRWLLPIREHYTAEPEIAYYLGLARDGLGREREARADFEAAYRTPSLRSAAALKLGELAARAGDRTQAEYYLQSLSGDPRAAEELALLEHPASDAPSLESDPERVLRAAAARMRLGLWRDALAGLSREYPGVPPEQKEPGAPLPQNDPIVAYYRAYCREKLGDSPDYEAASKLPTTYVFPSGAATLAVLEAAVRARPGDAVARYLLGDLRMASGLVDQAVDEWQTARRLNPAIPVLDASLGRVLLRVRHDPQTALEVFRAGLSADRENLEVYSGIDEAMSVLGTPAAERAAALERYPDRADMPAPLVYELALSYAEAGEFEKAKALFQNRFFAREEGGTNVRQVWVRVRALEAAHSSCNNALDILDHLGSPVPGLTFTRDGLGPFLAEPGNQPELGSVEARCGRVAAANARVEPALHEGDTASVAFAYLLARTLPGFDRDAWKARLATAADRARSSAGAGAWQVTVRGLLELESGDSTAGRETLQSVILLPDRNLAHHYSRFIRGWKP